MDASLYSQLLERIGADHAQRRLKLQAIHSAVRFGATGLHVYPENLDFMSSYLKFFLKMTGLWNRARHNSLRYQVVERTVSLPRLPATFEGFRILHLSDLHIEGIPDQGKKLRELIRGLEYDLCVLTGDFRFLTFGDYKKTLAHMSELVKVIQCPHGMIGILGNHDFLEMVPGLENMSIRMLLNESMPLVRGGQTLWIAGVDDAHWYEVADLPKALRSVPSDIDTAKILLAHSPDLMEEAATAGIDFYLCGHSHGGQICLPGGIPILTGGCSRKQANGSWVHQQMQGYTSRGIGGSILPVRLFCRPEIIVHRLTRQGNM